ncbi:hypothetical protein [Microbacterium sp. NPDC058389]|uniref:hypothetical protein n=1 Tax=Microbacterium sp. NPDC058389 TaxID=3346475 RepID=UPI003659BF09
MKRRPAQRVITTDERLARYAYLLGNVPASVADKSFAAAFAGLSDLQRQNLLDELCSLLPIAPTRPRADDPAAFAVFMHDLYARDAFVRVSGADVLAASFIGSSPIAAYFTAGAGSVTIEHQPLWVQELVGHETAPIDSGRMHHRPGVNSGDWYI